LPNGYYTKYIFKNPNITINSFGDAGTVMMACSQSDFDMAMGWGCHMQGYKITGCTSYMNFFIDQSGIAADIGGTI
jgi:hypothetical protein